MIFGPKMFPILEFSLCYFLLRRLPCLSWRVVAFLVTSSPPVGQCETLGRVVYRVACASSYILFIVVDLRSTLFYSEHQQNTDVSLQVDACLQFYYVCSQSSVVQCV